MGGWSAERRTPASGNTRVRGLQERCRRACQGRRATARREKIRRRTIGRLNRRPRHSSGVVARRAARGGERAPDGLAGNVSSTTGGQGARLGRRIDVGSRGHSRIPVIPSLTRRRCRPTRTPRLRVVSLFILLLPPPAFDYLRDLLVLFRHLLEAVCP